MALEIDPYIFPIGTHASRGKPDTGLMGAKGANLAIMSSIGMTVPPAFVVGSNVGKAVAAASSVGIDKEIASSVRSALADIEAELGRTFGSSTKPLLVSVRSGAAISMPGMMDTVLNLGLNDVTVEALSTETSDPRFAWDSYRRFVQSFAQVVLDVESYEFEDVLDEMRIRNSVDTDSELDASTLKEITSIFKGIVLKVSGHPFPHDVFEQLNLALLAVFQSWNTDRARRFRDIHNISHEGGTAAIIQAMVFGNRDANSCTGVYFTRNPSTGEAKPYGEYMPNAQGEDVVSGIRTPRELTEEDRVGALSENPSMEALLPDAYKELVKAGGILERHFHDMQEIEFTVEEGKLYLLQTRSGKRSANAGLKIVVDMVGEGILKKEQAVEACDMNALETMLVAKVAPNKGAVLVTKGLPASPGAVSGQIVFNSDDAVNAKKMGCDCILVRPETDPKDVHGMDAAVGILTTRGGMTSHAAVVARGMGKPCITAAMTLKIDLANQVCSSAGRVLKSGDVITIDGSSGMVYQDVQPVVSPEPTGELALLLSWRQEMAG